MKRDKILEYELKQLKEQRHIIDELIFKLEYELFEEIMKSSD